MRKVYQKLLLLLISSALCIFYLHIKWTKDRWFFTVSPQNSVTYEHRRAIVELYCEKNNLINSSVSLDQRVAAQLYVEHSHKFIYCEVPKVGCSNWKRIILLLNDSLGRSLTELKHYEVHTSSLLIKLRSYPPAIQTQLLANYTKVMFTRDPLERVVSAYRDKFLHEDDIYYSRTITNRIKRTVRKNKNSTENITFEEFVRYIVQEDRRYRDTHWRPMYHLCDPCNIHYDIIGKFETIKQDADFVLKAIGAPKDLSYPNMKHHSNDTRTNDQIRKHYLESLSSSLFGQLVNVYSVDFSMFEYSHYNNTKSFENKLDV